MDLLADYPLLVSHRAGGFGMNAYNVFNTTDPVMR